MLFFSLAWIFFRFVTLWWRNSTTKQWYAYSKDTTFFFFFFIIMLSLWFAFWLIWLPSHFWFSYQTSTVYVHAVGCSYLLSATKEITTNEYLRLDSMSSVLNKPAKQTHLFSIAEVRWKLRNRIFNCHDDPFIVVTNTDSWTAHQKPPKQNKTKQKTPEQQQ